MYVVKSRSMQVAARKYKLVPWYRGYWYEHGAVGNSYRILYVKILYYVLQPVRERRVRLGQPCANQTIGIGKT